MRTDPGFRYGDYVIALKPIKAATFCVEVTGSIGLVVGDYRPEFDTTSVRWRSGAVFGVFSDEVRKLSILEVMAHKLESGEQ